MKVLLEIKDSKAKPLLEALKSLSYVKATPISEEKGEILEEMKNAVEELKLILSGEKEARDANDFLNEL